MAENEGTTTQVVESPTQAVTPAQTPAVNTTEAQAAEETISLDEAKKLRREAQSLRKRLEVLDLAEQQRKDAELSETDKLKKQLAEKDAALKLREHEDLQRQAAEKAGLPTIFADRLKGETLEDLEADAKLILGALPKAQPANPGATNPGSNATGNGETLEQQRARIYGYGVNIFDPTINKKMGGGVFTVTKEDQS